MAGGAVKVLLLSKENNFLRVQAVRACQRALVWLLTGALVLLAAACRGAAARAAPLPQPTNFAQWLAIAVFVIGIWWVAMKILRG
jgi:hypothetical protein